MKQKTDERLHNIRVKYGKVSISDKKFILQILELLYECNKNLIRKQGENVNVKTG